MSGCANRSNRGIPLIVDNHNQNCILRIKKPATTGGIFDLFWQRPER
jgi:hypothetical protein